MVRCVGHQGSLEGDLGGWGPALLLTLRFASNHRSRLWCVHPGGHLKWAPCRQWLDARPLRCSVHSTVSGGFKT